MTTTTYYNLNIAEGTDIVNPLTVDNPNYEKIDETMHNNAVAGVTLATELTNATIHALTRENSDCSVIRFIATSRWKAGDTVTVDGVPVLALLPSGETLPDGAYVINANVLCVLTGTNLTVYVSKSSGNASDITYKETNVEAALDSLNESMVTVTGDLSTVSSNVSTINNNLSRYNPDTDAYDIYYNGKIVGSIPCGFKSFKFANTAASDWTCENMSVSTDGNTITFSPSGLSTGGSWSALYNKTITVNENKKLYYECNDSALYNSGSIQISNNNSTWTTIVSFTNGVGGSGSVDLSAGTYFVKFNGWANANPAPAVFTTLEIR